MYAKLENGKLRYAPKVLHVDGITLVNPSHDALVAAGYLPVKLTDATKVEAGFIAMPSWEQTENEIVRMWKVFPDMNPLSVSEVMEMLIPQQINTLSVDDNTALRMKEFYPAFESVIGQTVKQGFKFTYADKLWKTEQPEMTIQEHYAPGVGTESLYSEVCETHAGTKEDPIPYSGNMELKAGMYYMQDWDIYLCTRDSIYPVHNTLADLVGQYVEKA